MLRLELLRKLLLVGVIIAADIGGNRKTGRNGNAGIGHLGQACAFAAQRVFHVALAFSLPTTEEVNVLLHLILLA